MNFDQEKLKSMERLFPGLSDTLKESKDGDSFASLRLAMFAVWIDMTMKEDAIQRLRAENAKLRAICKEHCIELAG